MELPKLTNQQQKFVLRYLTNGNNASEAYRLAYDCKGSTSKTINEEASKLLKSPKVAPWVAEAQKNAEEVFRNELEYSVKDCFNELVELQERCKYSSKTYNVEKGCIELKGKLAGFFVDRHQVNGTLAEYLDKLK